VVLAYAFTSASELLISALGTSMVAKLVPKKLMGIMMGFWFASCAVGGILSGTLAKLAAVPKIYEHDPAHTLVIYTNAFGNFALIALGFGVLLCALSPVLTKLAHSQ
jgi:POT family proton-dependent oligopeptide transporter